MGRACSTNWGEEESEGKKPLGRPRSRWVDNIKIDLKIHRMGWCGLD
jgi:hypothetical protein